MNGYNARTDEELAVLAQTPNTEAEQELTNRYYKLASIVAWAFVIPGTDVDDRHSEALIGLVKAVRGWEPGKGTKFRTFAKMAMKRVLIDLHRSTRQTSAVPDRLLRSLDDALGQGDDDVSLVDIIAGPDDTAAEVHNRDDATNAMASLAADHREAVQGVINGSPKSFGRLLASFVSYARDMAASDRITLDVYGDIAKLVSHPGQFDLFGEILQSVDISAAAKDALNGYLADLQNVLADLAEGYDYPEMAARNEVSTETISLMIAGVRDRAADELSKAA